VATCSLVGQVNTDKRKKKRFKLSACLSSLPASKAPSHLLRAHRTASHSTPHVHPNTQPLNSVIRPLPSINILSGPRPSTAPEEEEPASKELKGYPLRQHSSLTSNPSPSGQRPPPRTSTTHITNRHYKILDLSTTPARFPWETPECRVKREKYTKSRLSNNLFTASR
jgi:hypothetical protein